MVVEDRDSETQRLVKRPSSSLTPAGRGSSADWQMVRASPSFTAGQVYILKKVDMLHYLLLLKFFSHYVL